MKQARNPACSQFRMAWVLIFFDLPVRTSEQRKIATQFRKDLIRDGYFMVQYSVYARPCGSADRVDTQVRRIKSHIPPGGEVRSMIITDAQWGRMKIYRNNTPVNPEQMPEQMLFF